MFQIQESQEEARISTTKVSVEGVVVGAVTKFTPEFPPRAVLTVPSRALSIDEVAALETVVARVRTIMAQLDEATVTTPTPPLPPPQLPSSGDYPPAPAVSLPIARTRRQPAKRPPEPTPELSPPARGDGPPQPDPTAVLPIARTRRRHRSKHAEATTPQQWSGFKAQAHERIRKNLPPQTHAQVIAEIAVLKEDKGKDYAEIADILNKKGIRTARKQPWTGGNCRYHYYAHHPSPRKKAEPAETT